MSEESPTSNIELSNSNLRSSINSSIFWSSLRLIGARFINILQLIILARILTPEDFGFFAVALMVYGFAEAISYIGFNQALIFIKNINKDHLNTLFVVNLIRGIILFLLIIIAAIPASKILNQPISYIYIFGISLAPVITSLHNPAIIIFQKNLNLKPELFFQLSGVLLSLICSITIASIYPSPWALVCGVIAQQFGQLIASYYLHPFRPKLQFNKDSFAPMANFGKWIILSQSLKYFVVNIPNWIIGILIGIQSLGLYRISGRLSEALGRDFSKMITSVAFPSFSFLQDSKTKLGEVYYASQRLVSFFCFLIFGILISLPERIVDVVLGDKWQGASEIVFLLSILSLIQNVGSQVEVIKASGNTKFLTIVVFIRVIIITLFIYPSVFYWGIQGAVYTVIISAIITLPLSMKKVSSFTQTKVSKIIKIYIPPLFAMIFMTQLAQYLDEFFISNFGNLSSQGLGSLIIILSILTMSYLLILYILDKVLKTDIYKEINALIFKRFLKY